MTEKKNRFRFSVEPDFTPNQEHQQWVCHGQSEKGSAFEFFIFILFIVGKTKVIHSPENSCCHNKS